MSRDGELVVHTLTQSIPAAYQPVFGAFAESALLNLLRQWCKQPPQQMRMTFELPSNYVAHVDRCQRIGQFTVDGEPLDVVVIHVRQLATWVHKQHVLHALVVRALRSWSVADFRAVVAYVAPDGTQWRMQLVEQEIERYQTPQGTSKTRQRVTSATLYRIEITANHVSIIPFTYWEALKYSSTPIQLNQLKEAHMALPSTPTEAFERAYEASIAAIEEYERILQTSQKTLTFAERAKIHEQLGKLHQLAHQWQLSVQPLIQLMRIENIQRDTTNQLVEPEGVPLTLDDSWRFRKPTAMRHGEKIYLVNNWQGVYATVIRMFIENYGDEFISKMNGTMQVTSRPFFSQQSEIYDRAAQVNGWYYEAAQKANRMSAHIKRMYQLYNIPFDSFKVWVVDES
jgi:hypothetical protein